MLDQRHEPELPVPDDREYADQADAELDTALVEAIEKAEIAGDDYLATTLRNELGSHYYDAKLSE